MKESQFLKELTGEAWRKGYTEGIRSEKRYGLVRLLDLRFGDSPTPDLNMAIHGMLADQEVEAWFAAAAVAESLEVFRGMVGFARPTSG